MNKSKLKPNYSVNEIKNLELERKKKANFLNQILDECVLIDMKSESSLPYDEKIKFLRKKMFVNYTRNLNPISNIKFQNLYINNTNRTIKKKILNPDKLFKDIKMNNDKEIEEDKTINNISYLIKPYHKERKHFPQINNQGNFFKDMSSFLFENVRKKKTLSKIINKRMKKIKLFIPIRNKTIILNTKRNDMSTLNRCYSNINASFCNNNILKSKSANNIRILNYDNDDKDKHYNPNRKNYEVSRYEDETYNFFMKEPMRSDKVIQWKFPPIYYCG